MGPTPASNGKRETQTATLANGNTANAGSSKWIWNTPSTCINYTDYPLAPEKLSVKDECLSSYQTALLENKRTLNCSKLVPNLMNKEKYVVQFLQLYMREGMKLTKVHRVLEFNEKPWMEPYICLNTVLRKQAKSAFEKDFCKLMNFGKTMENLRKRVDIKLVRSDGTEKLRKIKAKPNFNRRVRFDELSAMHVNKTHLTLNKPIYVGFTVLDL